MKDRFQHFRDEMGGYHDTRRAVLLGRFVEDPGVVHHESSHGRIFINTLDGQLLSILNLILRSGDLDGGLQAKVESLVDRIVETSLFAHEACATYLGVKTLPASETEAEVEGLGPEYRRYYEWLASSIDPYWKGTYVQHLIGWNVAVLTFSSYLVDEVLASPIGAAIELTESLRGNDRLAVVLTGFEQAFRAGEFDDFASIARTVAAEHGHGEWDLESDECWEKFPEIGTEIEIAVSRRTREWARSALELPFFPDDRIQSTMTELMEKVKPFGILPADPDIFGSTHSSELGLVTETWSLAGSIVENLRPIVAPLIPISILRFVEGAPSVAVVSDHPAAGTGLWTIVRGDGNKASRREPVLARFPREDVMRWLGRERSPEPEVRTVTIALEERNPQPMSQFWNELGDDEARVRDLANGRVCWYLLGNYVEWLRLLGMTGSLHLFRLYPEGWQDHFRQGLEPSLLAGTALKCLRASQVNNLFLRVFSATAAAYLESLEGRMMDQGKIHSFPSEELGSVTRTASLAKQLVEKVWPYY